MMGQGVPDLTSEKSVQEITQQIQALQAIYTGKKEKNTVKQEISPGARYSQLYAATMVSKEKGKEVVTMSLMDSGNLLKYSVISEELHKELKLGLFTTQMVAKTANSSALKILGISSPIQIKFAQTDPVFTIEPLVIQALTSHLNLGAQFNFHHQITPQLVVMKEGIKQNHMKVGDQMVRLFHQGVTRTQLYKEFQRTDVDFCRVLGQGPTALLGKPQVGALLGSTTPCTETIAEKGKKTTTVQKEVEEEGETLLKVDWKFVLF